MRENEQKPVRKTKSSWAGAVSFLRRLHSPTLHHPDVSQNTTVISRWIEIPTFLNQKWRQAGELPCSYSFCNFLLRW